MKKVIGFIFIATGIILGIYVGAWLLFAQPIIGACMAFDAGTLSATIIGTTIIKCIISTPVGWFIAFIGSTIGGYLCSE